jgi:hypothetical protein
VRFSKPAAQRKRGLVDDEIGSNTADRTTKGKAPAKAERFAKLRNSSKAHGPDLTGGSELPYPGETAPIDGGDRVGDVNEGAPALAEGA